MKPLENTRNIKDHLKIKYILEKLKKIVLKILLYTVMVNFPNMKREPEKRTIIEQSINQS